VGNLDLESILYAVELCNRYGIDTISIGSYLAWAMELYQRGIIDMDMTGIPLDWGNGDTVIELIHQIAHRRGFGNILAEGPYACRHFGKGSEDYFLGIKNFPIEMTDERAAGSFALGMATASRGACHMRSRPSIDVLGLPGEILEKVYGGPVGDDLGSYAGKGRMVWWHERLNAVADSVGICRFMTVFSSIHALEYDAFSRLIELMTGLSISPEELRVAGERICTLERTMLNKDGIDRRQDTVPRRYFDEPIPAGPAKGEVISRERFDEMLDEYYMLHGWDKNGIPLKETKEKLGLEA
jgi:aldehyde:ferredoxin oxidoreductase